MCYFTFSYSSPPSPLPTCGLSNDLTCHLVDLRWDYLGHGMDAELALWRNEITISQPSRQLPTVAFPVPVTQLLGICVFLLVFSRTCDIGTRSGYATWVVPSFHICHPAPIQVRTRLACLVLHDMQGSLRPKGRGGEGKEAYRSELSAMTRRD